MAEPAPLVRMGAFTYSYPGSASPALEAIDLELREGELTVLAGRSGSGKSSLLRACCGLVPHYHGGEVSGTLEVCELDVREHGPAELGGLVGLVAQEPEAQVVSATVRGELELPLELRAEPAAASARAVEEVTLALGIEHLVDRPVDSLSGGELQRVALAAALVLRPRLVLLDEPTAQLDPVAGDELIGLLRRLNEEWGMGVLLGEHRLERCLAAADRAIFLERGRVAFDGPPGELSAWLVQTRPFLATPGARLFSLSGLGAAPVSVKQARRSLAQAGLAAPPATAEADPPPRRRRGRSPGAALDVRRLRVELDAGDGPREVLRGLDLAVDPGERVALMGRNGAGKSTLLRVAAGLVEPVRGTARAPQGCALLPQSAGDMLVRERVGDELDPVAGPAALASVGLEWAADSDPRDLSGGERERLALALVMAGREDGALPGLICLDEPTRGVDAERKLELARWIGGLAERGPALLVATHDVEFAARAATRVVLLGDGELIADGPVDEILSGGWYFATEVARILGVAGAVTPEQGAELLRAGGSERHGSRDVAADLPLPGVLGVSWQAVTLAGLALVLVGGFGWYERTRPSARVVALVAALAAIAVAGRLVVAPLPNVVATTDIALIAGYALGAGPGFAVGALAAPISNIWLGQGPWTAWEMAGWGLVGLGGAWLGVVTRRRLGRLGLALACALAGLAYGALLDLSVMVTYGGEQSLDRYLALSARAIPFNVAHAAGNFAIAMAAGPALVRMISRFRGRLEFNWRPSASTIAVLALAIVAPIAVAAGAARTAVAAEDPVASRGAPSAAAWLARAQNSDGGFAASPGQPSSPAMTGWAVLGLEAAGRNPLDVRRSGHGAIEYLRSQAGRLRSVGDLERTILGLVGAGLNPRRFAGSDLVERLRRRRDGDGSVDAQVNLTAFYVLAMRAAGADPASLRRSARWLRGAQNDDGGWGIAEHAPSEADSTGAALQGLVAAGARGSASAAGATWLRSAQRSGGGYALGGSGVVNSQSTAWAVQGLVAAGSGRRQIGRALGYLGDRRGSGGHYRYSASSDQTPVWVTSQALLAVERRAFPLAAVPRSSGSSRASSEHEGAGGAAQRRSGSATSSSDTADAGTAGAASTESAGTNGAATASSAGSAGNGGAGDSRSAASRERAGASGAAAQTEGQTASTAAASGSGAGGSSAPAPVEEATATADAAQPVSVGYAAPSGGDDSTTVLLVAVGVLAAIACGGLVWSRRR